MQIIYDEWLKIYPLICLLLFLLACNAGLRKNFAKAALVAFLMFSFVGCILFGGFLYGTCQIVLLIAGSCYYYRSGSDKYQAISR
ncbi:hypothetical protein [Paracidovorax avenae]|uniref:hypothetical protein n=1 Tax=Paracidovorax avenae TaxID=80867 RepID=UPI001260241C|nr:hypothetical protein [Paracidovorax avenae]